MQVYSIDIFNRRLDNIYHDQVEFITYDVDYLAPCESRVLITESALVEEGNIIRVQCEPEIIGMITEVNRTDEGMEIAYKPMEAVLLDMSVLFDTNLQGSSTSLETMIANYIKDYYVTNTDSLQNIPCIGEVKELTSTKQWGFNLKSDKEGMHHCIVNLYTSIITRSFTKYGVVVRFVPNWSIRRINIEIGIVPHPVRTIESDLKNVLWKNVVIRQTQNSTNKLTIWNDANYNQSVIYYLHPDGSYNTSNSNRLTPVYHESTSVTVEDGQTFASAAAKKATEKYGQIQFNNLIELEVENDDSMIRPYELVLGQTICVMHKGCAYNSILSGISVGEQTKLTFGTIRLDLSKIIRMGGR